MKRKIGIFTRPVDQGTSGSGHHLKEMILHLMNINKLFDITFLHYTEGNDEIYNFAPDIILPRNPIRAAEIIKRHDFDLIHYSPLTIYAPIFGLPKIKKIATAHGVEPYLCPELYDRLTVWHEKYVFPLYARKMDHIITVSETSKQFFVDHYRVKMENISVCYNGLSSSYHLINKKDIRGTLTKYNINGPYLFHVSRYSERKNPWTMLKAMKKISEKYKDLYFVIAGNGWDNTQTLNFLHRMNLQSKIIFTGFTPENEVVDLLNGAELFIFPSFAEGFGMPNVEAMACGCPVITSSVFAIPEIVGDGAHILKQADDENELSRAIEDLLQDERKRKDLIEKGFKRTQIYNWPDSALKMYQIYRRILSVS
jgi:glycosyltransferase involved in cell wall biosynthesis